MTYPDPEDRAFKDEVEARRRHIDDLEAKLESLKDDVRDLKKEIETEKDRLAKFERGDYDQPLLTGVGPMGAEAESDARDDLRRQLGVAS